MEWSSRRRAKQADEGGFTLVELLVVMSLIGLLIAIAMPAIGRVRESGRDVSCKSNLRQLAMGLIQHADSHQTLCSGAFDWKNDGCVTDTGWVADLVNAGIPVGKLLCPSNPAQLNEQYEQLLGYDPTSNACADSLGPAQRYLDGQSVMSVCRQLATLTGEQRVPLIEQLLEDGYNTNYVATWLLTRSDVKLDAEGNLTGGNSNCPTGLMSRNSTAGPLNKARIGVAALPTNRVPLLGCANVADLSDGVLSTGVGLYSVGTRLSESNTDGPVDTTTMKPPIMPGGKGATVWRPYWTKALQDYRDLGPVHGGGSRRSCNIAFLDGSVRHFIDNNGDGFLNNGFPASPNNGFDDGEIELPATEVFSGFSTDPSRVPRR